MVNRIKHLRLDFQIASLLALISGILLFNAAHSFASDFQSPRTAALGGAGHAGPLLNDAIYLNPSYAAFLPTYAISGNYSWANFQDGSYKYKIQNASVQDGRSDLFQAGLAYSRRDDGTLIHLGTAKALIPQRLGIGLGGKSFSPANDSNTRILDATVSATSVLSQSIQVSFLGDNLIDPSSAKQYGFYREYTVGTKFNLQQIVLMYFDPHYTPDITSYGKYGYEAGAEWPMFTDFFLRGGYFHNSNIPSLGNGTYGNGYGFGVGFLAPRLSIDYGVSRVREPILGTVQVIGFTVFM